MERPSYLSNYLFNWEVFNVMLNGKSPLDSEIFVGSGLTKEMAQNFMDGYGLDSSDPVSKAEIFGSFQEALQFIRRYFLKEGNPEGLDFKVPNALYTIVDIEDLFVMAAPEHGTPESEDRIWAEIVLKIMHTILHIDKDLRSNYFTEIQTQIFDRFYKYLRRDGDNKLHLGTKENPFAVPLVDFETKAKKSRDSVIIKLLHKSENVAEELFDRVGVRFITETRFDTMRVIKFLVENNVIIPHNAKSSRSVNGLIDIEKFKDHYNSLIKMSIRNNLSEDRFLQAMEREILECAPGDEKNDRNVHSKNQYRSIQFTSRQLIKYSNPFLQEFNYVRKFAKELDEDNVLAKKVLAMDMSLIAKDVRFFYPYEVQVVDKNSHKANTEGEASHLEYKKAQLIFARDRVFKSLIDFYNKK